jgi:hypothetical protein
MAGAGFKTFNSGDILGASDVNTYLMQQTVMVFATAAARGSAIASPTQGMTYYQSDEGRTYTYTGLAWKPNTPFTYQNDGSNASVTTTATATWSTGTTTVTFTSGRFTQTPVVVVTPNFSSSNAIVTQIQGVSSTGFTLRASIYANVAATIPINWIATQSISSSGNG